MSAQLEMIWPKAKMADALDWTMPDGYELRNFSTGDEDEYIALMHAAGFESWTRDTLDEVIQQAVPDGVFFAVHSDSSQIAATAMAWYRPNTLFPDGHEMGWVAAHPEHRGHGLGRVVTAAATRASVNDGARHIYLLTDDWRLPAINSYLEVGYAPYHASTEKTERWRKVFLQLGLDRENDPAVHPPA